MPIDPQPVAAGDIPSASWANALLALAKRARVIVAPNSAGLYSRESSEGTTIGLSLPPPCYHARVTQTISLATTLSNGLKLGKGRATVYFEAFDQNNDGTLVPTVGDQWVYFAAPSGGDTTPIAVGQWIMVARTASGRYSVCTGYC